MGTSHSPAGERHADIETQHRNPRDAKRGELPDYRQAVHVRAGLHKSTAQKLKDETMPTRIHVSTCNVRYIMPFQLLADFFFFSCLFSANLPLHERSRCERLERRRNIRVVPSEFQWQPRQQSAKMLSDL